MQPNTEFTFQNIDDLKHTAKTTLGSLRDKSPTALEWPSQSPNLYPIKHLWRDLKMAVNLILWVQVDQGPTITFFTTVPKNKFNRLKVTVNRPKRNKKT